MPATVNLPVVHLPCGHTNPMAEVAKISDSLVRRLLEAPYYYKIMVDLARYAHVPVGNIPAGSHLLTMVGGIGECLADGKDNGCPVW